jgi:hypothetical protein
MNVCKPSTSVERLISSCHEKTRDAQSFVGCDFHCFHPSKLRSLGLLFVKKREGENARITAIIALIFFAFFIFDLF